MASRDSNFSHLLVSRVYFLSLRLFHFQSVSLSFEADAAIVFVHAEQSRKKQFKLKRTKHNFFFRNYFPSTASTLDTMRVRAAEKERELEIDEKTYCHRRWNDANVKNNGRKRQWIELNEMKRKQTGQ